MIATILVLVVLNTPPQGGEIAAVSECLYTIDARITSEVVACRIATAGAEKRLLESSILKLRYEGLFNALRKNPFGVDAARWGSGS